MEDAKLHPSQAAILLMESGALGLGGAWRDHAESPEAKRRDYLAARLIVDAMTSLRRIDAALTTAPKRR